MVGHAVSGSFLQSETERCTSSDRTQTFVLKYCTGIFTWLLLKVLTWQKKWWAPHLQSSVQTDWGKVGCKVGGSFQWLLFWVKAVPFLFSGSCLFPKDKSVVRGAWIWNKINNMRRKDAIYGKLTWAQQQGQEQSQRRPRNSSSRIHRGSHRHTAVFRDLSLCLPFSHLGNKKEEWIPVGHIYAQMSGCRASSSEH